MSTPKLVVFDVDGTLVDSQGDILASMAAAFEEADLLTPPREAILGIVGLSLNVAIPRLAPEQGREVHYLIEDAYKRAYIRLRSEKGAVESSPLYPGARETLDWLIEQPGIALGVATGKSRRGLDKLLQGHGLSTVFATEQVADFHPSKPHPSMLHAALEESGVAPGDAVMVGDTSYDMEMAKAAGLGAIGVSWGYHARVALSAADEVIDRFDALPTALGRIWGN